MESVIKEYENDMEWYVLNGKFSGEDLFTGLFLRQVRQAGLTVSSASKEELAHIEELARAEMRNWEEKNEADRLSFPEFRMSVLSELKDIGDGEFLGSVSVYERIPTYFGRFWFHEAMYLDALLDTLCAQHNVTRENRFPAFHKCKLAQPLSAISEEYPFELEQGLPLFAERNIYEPDIRRIS